MLVNKAGITENGLLGEKILTDNTERRMFEITLK